MALSLTRYGAKALQDHALGLVSAAFGPKYFALFSSDPTEDGLTTGEPSGNGYARLLLTSSMSPTTLATGYAVNSSLIQFATASGQWGTTPLTHFGTMDALTGGNMWHYGALAMSFLVYTGDAPPFSEGSIIFIMD